MVPNKKLKIIVKQSFFKNFSHEKVVLSEHNMYNGYLFVLNKNSSLILISIFLIRSI